MENNKLVTVCTERLKRLVASVLENFFIYEEWLEQDPLAVYTTYSKYIKTISICVLSDFGQYCITHLRHTMHVIVAYIIHYTIYVDYCYIVMCYHIL